MSAFDQIMHLLPECSEEERKRIFHFLRQELAIHPLEEKLNAKAEVILEAFSKANDLTMRGIRGIIAEATFVVDVAGELSGWKDITPKGDHAYDCILQDNVGDVRIQIKMQRLKNHQPMMASQGYRFLPADMFVVETQRTRGGKDSKGEKTRPYRYGEFDILGVCLHPSTGDWRDFVFTVANWLIPDRQNPTWILKFQPVSIVESDFWTRDFDKCVRWLRSGEKKCIPM